LAGEKIMGCKRWVERGREREKEVKRERERKYSKSLRLQAVVRSWTAIDWQDRRKRRQSSKRT
jgi:hypothetical protein